MQIVEATADAEVFDADGQATYHLRAGGRYILYDAEVGHGLRDGALRLVEGLDRRLPVYRGEPLDRQRLILPFIGRKGDAIVVASCLSALKERYPEITIDVAAPDSPREVLELTPSSGELQPYPLIAGQIGGYDYYMSFEEVEIVPRGWHRSYADVFSACLHTPRPDGPPDIVIPSSVRQRWALVAISRPRVAIHVGVPGSLRSYPADLSGQLAQRLVDAGLEVYLIGAAGAADRTPAPITDRIHNLCGKTSTPADLAAVLAQMDAAVTGDSFPMHLAGALKVPTIALFTATGAVIGSDYPSVVAIASEAQCSPCRLAGGLCPLGHGECIAHREHSLSPESLVKRVSSLTALAGVV